MPAFAMGRTALRVMAVTMALALLRTPVIAAGAALLLMRSMRLMAGVWLMRLVRPRLRVPAAIGRCDRRSDQLLDIA